MTIAAAFAAGDASGAVAQELDALASMIRRSTVQVRTGDVGVGSGVIWSADGLVLTNAHVARAQRTTVRLWDGEMLPGRVIRRDPRRDLAAIALDARDLPAAPPGDSAQLRSGQVVIALGSPWGVPNVLTFGIVHSSGRAADGSPTRIVRADVRLAPGNSGGPLVNVCGRVVGINTMIANGLGIAIATIEIDEFLQDLAAARGRPGGSRAA